MTVYHFMREYNMRSFFPRRLLQVSDTKWMLSRISEVQKERTKVKFGCYRVGWSSAKICGHAAGKYRRAAGMAVCCSIK